MNKDYKKILVKDIKIFLSKKMEKSDDRVVNITKISQKMKNKTLLSMEKNIIESEKMSYCNYKKLLFKKMT